MTVRASFESLVNELADPGRPITVSKLVNLSYMGAEQASLFMNAFMEMDGRKRERLLHELVDLAEDNVELNFDNVFLLALADHDAEVRRTAVQGLWEHEGRDLIDPLIGLLRDDLDAGVRAEAALALGRFALQAEFETLRPTDVERVDDALRRTIADPTEPVEVRARAIEAAGARSQDWARDIIEDAIESDDRRIRISAVHAMGRSCEGAWLSYVIRELESDDAEMRYEAAFAAGSIAEPEALPYLVPLLHDEDPQVQEAAIGALGEIRGEEAKDVLEELLQEGDARIHDAVRSALAEIAFAEDPMALEGP